MKRAVRLTSIGLFAAAGLALGACDLNPQPLPPGDTASDDAGRNGGSTGSGANDGAQDAGIEPPVGIVDAGGQGPAFPGDSSVAFDSGGAIDAAAGDASSDASADGGVSDGGDDASDGSTDGSVGD